MMLSWEAEQKYISGLAQRGRGADELSVADLPVGTKVRVVHTTDGTPRMFVGCTGVVIQQNFVRVIVRLDEWGERRGIRPECLEIVG